MEESPHPGFWAEQLGSKRFLEQVNERIAHTPPATQPLLVLLLIFVIVIGTANIIVLIWLFLLILFWESAHKVRRPKGWSRLQGQVKEA